MTWNSGLGGCWRWIEVRLFVLVVALGVAGCGRNDGNEARVAETPREAAGQLDVAFSGAPAEFRRAAADASEALRSGDLSRAVESLGVLRSSGDVSLQQGLAVHSSLVVLEGRLAAAAEGGDARARAAYDQLRRMKQK